MPSCIARVVFGIPVDTPFDYSVPESYRAFVCPGVRVLVSFAGRKKVGIVVSLAGSSDFPELKPLLAVLDEQPSLPSHALRLAEVFALRFGCSFGEALVLFLPGYWRLPRKRPDSAAALSVPRVPKPRVARGAVELYFDDRQRKCWPVLLEKIGQTLQAGQGVLVLVPDAGYLADTLGHLRGHGFDPLVLSGGTQKQEAGCWDELCRGHRQLAVGFISAALTPVPDLGLIVIVDEESHSYKHDQSPFYHAREAVFLRSRLEGCTVAMVSLAPSVEAWHEASLPNGRMIRFTDSLAPVRLMDLGNFKMRRGSVLSLPLRITLEKILQAKGRAVLYIQAARGTASVMQEIKEAFVHARVAGYDSSSAQWPGSADIVVATQSLFRFRSTLVCDFSCVLDIDREFHRLDHRAAHAAFSLIRYLRAMTRTEVLVQTRNAADPTLQLAAADDPLPFYAGELEQRREMGFPPFQHIVALVARSADSQLACDEAKRLYDMLLKGCPAGLVLMEPQPDRSAVLRGKYRWCVIIQGGALKVLMGHVRLVLRTFRGRKDTVVTVNVDP